MLRSVLEKKTKTYLLPPRYVRTQVISKTLIYYDYLKKKERHLTHPLAMYVYTRDIYLQVCLLLCCWWWFPSVYYYQ